MRGADGPPVREAIAAYVIPEDAAGLLQHITPRRRRGVIRRTVEQLALTLHGTGLTYRLPRWQISTSVLL